MYLATFLQSYFLFSIVPFSQSSFQIDPNSNEYLLAKIGVDTDENEPLGVWGKIIQYYSFASLERMLKRGTYNSRGEGIFFDRLPNC